MYDGDKAVLTMVQYLKEDKETDGKMETQICNMGKCQKCHIETYD